jgi:hypothetical protein
VFNAELSNILYDYYTIKIVTKLFTPPPPTQPGYIQDRIVQRNPPKSHGIFYYAYFTSKENGENKKYNFNLKKL